MATGLDLVAAAYYGLPPLATLLQALLAVWLSRNFGDQRGTRWFVITLAFGVLHTLFFSVQLLGSTVAFQSVFASVAGFFAYCSFVAFTVFAGRYTGSDFHRNPVVATALTVMVAGYPVLFGLGLVSDLWTVNERLVQGPILYLAYDLGPGLAALFLVAYAVSLYTTYRLIRFLLSTSRRATGQLSLLLAGAVTVALGPIVSAAGVFPAEDLNHIPYTTVLFVLFVTFALFRFDLLRVQPVARNAVVENLQDPVVVLDDDRTVVDYNDAASDIWPDIADAVGTPFETACPALAETVDLDDPAASDRITLPVEDTDRHFSVTVSTVRADGSGGEWLSILLRDVTALEQSRWQLEKQNERLDQVASTISHDLRNPINVADGSIEIAEKRLEPGMDRETVGEVREYLERTRDTHGRMEEIISDILTIAREGKTVEETQQVSLEDLARDAWDNVDTDEATLSVARDRTLAADRSKLLTVFENCFRNSVDHGPEDVTVEVGATADGFYVADDGPGIPDEHRDGVFEYGYTTSQEGTGLGLSIVKTMAESHGWTVALDDDYDDGTRFVFETGGSETVSDAGRQPVELP